MNLRTGMKIAAGLAVVAALAGLYWSLEHTGLLATLTDGRELRQTIVGLGAAGPLAVVGFMTLAILVSPIPSAPIALAAGAAYGHTWGTLYVLAGAELGALLAFGLARVLGRDALQRWLGARLPTHIGDLADGRLDEAKALVDTAAARDADTLLPALLLVMGRLAAPWQLIRLAVRRMLPPWVNAAVEMVKATSLVSLIGVPDLLMQTQQLTSRTLIVIPFYATAALLYFAVNYSLSSLARYLERRFG